MNKMKFMVLFMSIAMIFGSCGSMNNTGKGAAIGGGSGAALGAILGGVIGKGKGAAIGAAIGTAVGADRKSTRLNSSHWNKSRMPSSA